MARTEIGRYNLIAAFADMTKAQQVIEALKDAGVGGEDISLLGKQGESVVADRHTSDRESIGETLKGTVTGALGGGVLGALGGFLIGLAALAIPGVGPVMTAGIWATAIGGGALFGAQGGAYIGAITGNELSETRSEAFQTHFTQGRVLIGVHSDSQDTLERASGVVARNQPLDIERFGHGVSASV